MHKPFEVLSLLHQRYGNVSLSIGDLHKLCISVNYYGREHVMCLDEDDFDLPAHQLFVRMSDQIETANGRPEVRIPSQYPMSGSIYPSFDMDYGWVGPTVPPSKGVMIGQAVTVAVAILILICIHYCS